MPLFQLLIPKEINQKVEYLSNKWKLSKQETVLKIIDKFKEIEE